MAKINSIERIKAINNAISVCALLKCGCNDNVALLQEAVNDAKDKLIISGVDNEIIEHFDTVMSEALNTPFIV